MLPFGQKEVETERRGVPCWVEVKPGEEGAVLAELVDFWSRQTKEDTRLRFMMGIDLVEIERRYSVALANCQIAICLRENGRLVGFFMGVARSSDPDWVEGCVEIDPVYRRQGYASSTWEGTYRFALARGLKGVRGEVHVDNIASLSMMKKFAAGKPHVVSQRGDVITYSIGPGVADLVQLDLL